MNPASRLPVQFQPRTRSSPPIITLPHACLYRGQCVALLRRYFTLSVEAGRMPSLLGREFFRAKVTSCRIMTFEDIVIFCHDVERCLDRLGPVEKEFIRRLVFQEYTQEETCRMLGCTRPTLRERYHDGLDMLSEMFLEARMLPLPRGRRKVHIDSDTGRVVTLHACAPGTETVHDPQEVA